MEQYIPDIYQKSIYTIDYDNLLLRGIKCLLFDLDNTLVPAHTKEANKKLKQLFDELKARDFKIIIFSNSSKNRVRPFKEELEVDCCASAGKPFPKKFLKIMEEYHFTVSEIAIIGDQMLTDVKGGNRIGITTILINPVSTKDVIWTKPGRLVEKRIMKKLRDRNLFAKGRYYV